MVTQRLEIIVEISIPIIVFRGLIDRLSVDVL